jgi:cytochrome P450
MSSNFHRPEDFVPERWLEDSDEYKEFANDNRAVFQPFSVGTRNCIGRNRNLAYAEMRLILAKVLYHFDLSLEEEQTGDWFDARVWGVWQKNPLWVKIHPRTS